MTEALMRRCSVCREPWVDACRRCGRPLCARHSTGAERRCSACEAEFAESGLEVSLVRGMLVVGTFSLVTLVTLVMSCLTLLYTSGPASALVGFALVVGAIGAGGGAACFAGRTHDRARRDRFLSEHHRALPAARLVRHRA